MIINLQWKFQAPFTTMTYAYGGLILEMETKNDYPKECLQNIMHLRKQRL